MEQNNNQESLNSIKNESIKDKIIKEKKSLDTLLRFYPLILSGISFFSVIVYFIHFGLGIKYFPALSGSDVFYFGGLILSISFIIFFFFFIFPSACYPSYHNNKSIISFTNISFVISVFIPLSFTSYLAFFYLTLLITDYNKILLDDHMMIVFSIVISLSYILCCMAIEKKELIEWIIVPFSLAVLCLAYSIYKFFSINNIDEAYLNILLFLLSSVGFITILPSFLYLSKKIYSNNDYRWLLLSMLIVASTYSPIVFANWIAGWLEISNINYKYIVIEKSALGAISDRIHQNGKNIGKCKTYYEEDKVSDAIKLYNIKALSTLGKFYYLETIDCEKDEKIRFEIDASKIISRQK